MWKNASPSVSSSCLVSATCLRIEGGWIRIIWSYRVFIHQLGLPQQLSLSGTILIKLLMYGSQLQLIPWQCLLRTAPTSTELHNALHQGYKAGMAQCFPCFAMDIWSLQMPPGLLWRWSGWTLYHSDLNGQSAGPIHQDWIISRSNLQARSTMVNLHVLKSQNCLRWIADLFRSVSLVVAAELMN